jgi:hypothetical protein
MAALISATAPHISSANAQSAISTRCPVSASSVALTMNVMFTQIRTPSTPLQIAPQSHDDGVNHEAMNDYRAQGRCESHKQGTKYRDVVRHHLARC